MSNIPSHHWRDLKQELMTRWRELTESELERTHGERRSIIELLERKVGLKIEDASERFEEIAERYHLFDEPTEEKPEPPKEKPERVFELSPKKKPAEKPPQDQMKS